MAYRSGSHRASMVVNLDQEEFEDVIGDSLNQQLQIVRADLEAAFHRRRLNHPEVHGAQVSIQINYNLRILETPAEVTDRIARLHSDLGDTIDETHQYNVTDGPDEEEGLDLLGVSDEQLSSLLLVDRDDLPQDSRDCPICQDPYPPVDSSQESDLPVLLHCDHIVGKACVVQWLLEGNNSCPLCRAAIFEPALPSNEEEPQGLSGDQSPNFAEDATGQGVSPRHSGTGAATEDSAAAPPV